MEEECRRAAALGMKTVILDDGWQTGDGNRGYAFCGDWEVYTPKFPDMRAHVDRVHALGMKYIVWFSVPFVGKNSRAFARFRDKLLHFDEKFGAGVLDPRYPQVREYLTGIYRDRMTRYGWDGLKLDFVDEFHEWEDTPPVSAQMDCPCIQDGVEKLMTEIRQAVMEVCPHAMIEFRQRYIGPDMRTFGNMFRVSDCPLDVLSNRVGIADLRMLSGDTAVHSDMLLAGAVRRGADFGSARLPFAPTGKNAAVFAAVPPGKPRNPAESPPARAVPAEPVSGDVGYA